MVGYGWDEYDVRQGGRQTIHDAGNHIDVTTEFVKFPGGEHGGSWGVRIKGTPRESAPPRLVTTMILYTALEGLGSLQVENEEDPLGYEGTVLLRGETNDLGNFKLEVTEGPLTNAHPASQHETYASKPLDRTMVASFQVPDDQIWQTKPVIFSHMKEEIDKYIREYGNENAPPPWQVFTIANRHSTGNVHVIQKVFDGPFEVGVENLGPVQILTDSTVRCYVLLRVRSGASNL